MAQCCCRYIMVYYVHGSVLLSLHHGVLRPWLGVVVVTSWWITSMARCCRRYIMVYYVHGSVLLSLHHGVLRPWLGVVVVTSWCITSMAQCCCRYIMVYYVHGSVQERHNSSALAMELCLSCTDQAIWSIYPYPSGLLHWHWGIDFPSASGVSSNPEGCGLNQSVSHHNMHRARSWNNGMRCMSLYTLMHSMRIFLEIHCGISVSHISIFLEMHCGISVSHISIFPEIHCGISVSHISIFLEIHCGISVSHISIFPEIHCGISVSHISMWCWKTSTNLLWHSKWFNEYLINATETVVTQLSHAHYHYSP